MRRGLLLAVVSTVAICVLGACTPAAKKTGRKKMVVTSPAFEEGGAIPSKYTADGPNVSPPLEWRDVPSGAKSIALICDDPDAPRGTWVHWIVYDLPPDTTKLAEHVPAERALKNGAKQGSNDFGKIGYGGPAPPSGTHRYFFKVYALDKMLDLQPGATKAQLVKAMEGCVLAEGQLMGRYSRR